MQVLNGAKVSTFFNWNRDADERSQLTLTTRASDVTLGYEDSFGESAVLTLSGQEAHSLADDILKLVPTGAGVVPYQEHTGASTNRADPESGLIIRVTYNTDGEPYREGVRLEVSRPDYTEVLCMDVDAYTAHRLANSLKAYCLTT
ncbi:hypothetical protein KBJ94_23615 [Pseudomonas sp. ITA]|uniref:hypothetical protein n=1 Tax=Pseudomonas sp. ITA TaxID=2825841 RepID=UPI002496206B|nr:hypothetical protein [Pseudomonas sp. ITA]MDI2145039.1 hypothetical protein [Pseudomonas sp. ITA]